VAVHVNEYEPKPTALREEGTEREEQKELLVS
jgi:hypothetical protein